MGFPYQSTSVSGYNSNPPADDGSQTDVNRVRWAKIKSKLTDPFSSFASAVNNAISAAFGKIPGGAGVADTAVSYAVLSADQGKLIRATAAGITITTPDAGDVGGPFLFRFLNDSDGDVQFSAFSGQTIDGVASISVPSKCGLTIDTNGTNWFTDGQNFQRTQIVPQGYLTLIPESTDPLSPVPSSDQSAKTAVYYRPDKGDLIPIPNGSNFAVKSFSELTLALVSNHVANAIYDVFVFDDGGTLRLVTGTAWNTATAGSGARGTGAGTTELTRLKGLLVNKNQMTVRNGATTYTMAAMSGLYVGTLYMDESNGQITCHVTAGQNRKWGVWNAYNKRQLQISASDSTTSWDTPGTSFRQSRGQTGNKVTVLTGISDSDIDIIFSQHVRIGTTIAELSCDIAIGINSTSSGSGSIGRHYKSPGVGIAVQTGATVNAEYVFRGNLGISSINCLERAPFGSSSNTAFDGGSFMRLTAKWMG